MVPEITYRFSTNVTGRAKTICCKKVDHFSEILCKYKVLREKNVSYFFKQV